MIRKAVWTVAIICCFLSFILEPQAFAGAEDAYDKAKERYQGFKKKKNLHKYRDKWMVHISAFERLSKKYPNHKRACDSLYNVGKLYRELSLVSIANKDRKAAAAAFEKLAARCGATSLADDGLYLASEMYVKLGNEERAKVMLDRLLSRFPNGDMSRKAKVLLASLGGGKAAGQSAKTAKAVEPVKETQPKKVAAGNIGGTIIVPDKGVILMKSVEFNSDEKSTLITLHFSRLPAMTNGQIAATEGYPRRLYFDFSNTELGESIDPIWLINDSRVNIFRVGQFSKEVVRVVFELTADAGQFNLSTSLKPAFTRIEIKLTPKAAAKPALAAVSPKPKPEAVKPKPVTKPIADRSHTSETEKSLEAILEQKPKAERSVALKAPETRKLDEVRLVVIDPGHGGDDQGAHGKKGTKEKDIALKIAKKLKGILEKEQGVKVILTRRGDKTMELFDRTKIANDSAADLFISIHCNATKKRKFQGFETFYLNNSSDRYSSRLADRENRSAGGQITDLEFILTDLSMNVNVNDSILLANMIQKSSVKRLKKKYKGQVDRGVRRAVFHVLLYARMPAVLVEAAFISNPTEEKRLRTDKYQEDIARGIAEGVKSYSEKLKKMAKRN